MRRNPTGNAHLDCCRRQCRYCHIRRRCGRCTSASPAARRPTRHQTRPSTIASISALPRRPRSRAAQPWSKHSICRPRRHRDTCRPCSSAETLGDFQRRIPPYESITQPQDMSPSTFAMLTLSVRIADSAFHSFRLCRIDPINNAASDIVNRRYMQHIYTLVSVCLSTDIYMPSVYRTCLIAV